ncbi:MAG: ACP S-malonyltransferase [Thermodesulfobacteriota bacterium]|nr:ACP S-malonyltransferase [Thermodesulfobacteriota bacterium]
MGRIVFCFPGQLQERPTLEDHHPLRRDPHFEEWLERASRQTDFDLLNFSFKGEEAGFNLRLQISTYLLSMVHFFRLRAEGWVPDVIAEHSMGIYAALAASEAITFQEGLYITESIGRLLEREGASSREAMGSIIGLPYEEIAKICQELDDHSLFIANYNGSMHFVISGDETGVEKAVSSALSKKAISASRLTFNIALHSPRLSVLSEEIDDLLKDIEVQSPKYPILNHWTVKHLKREEIKGFLSQEIGRPVHWDRCVEKLIQEGVNRFIEVGHGTTLSKLIRWIDREMEAFSAGDHFKEGTVK